MLKRPIFAYDAASSHFAMAVGTQTVRLWRLDDVEADQTSTKPEAELSLDRSALVGMALTAGQLLVTIHETGVVLAWELDSIGAKQPSLAWKFEADIVVGEVTSYRQPETGRHLMALGGDQGQLLLLQIGGEGEPAAAGVANAHGDKIEVLAFSKSGTQIATSARDREIAIWSTTFVETEQGATLESTRRLTGSGGWPLSLAFSSDEKRLVSGAMDNGVYLWDLEADEALKAVRFDHHGWVEDVQWSDDDQTILSASWDGTTGVFDARSLTPKFQFMYHDDYVVKVMSVPGTSQAFAASYDGDVTVWEYKKGRLEAILEGHGDWVSELVVLDDDLVASLSSDGTARLWSVDDLSLFSVIGDATVEGFELGGSFDLASFGIGERQSQLGDDSGPDLEAMQSKVVRRYDSDDPLTDSGSQNTAINMLEEAVETAEEVDADTPPPELGGELSDMVLDAISDVEENDELESVGDVELDDIDVGSEKLDDVELDDHRFRESGADNQEWADSEAMTQKLDPQDFGDAVEPVSEVDEPSADSGALDMLDTPEMESAQGQDLGAGLDEPDSDVAADWIDDSDAAVGDDAEAGFEELDLDPEQEGFPDVDDIADQAFEEVHGGVDIMDSVFDTDSESTDEGAVSDSEDSDDPAPTSGPLYDPQPMGPDDDIDEFLPDDDELDLAFSSSVVESVDDDEDGNEESAGEQEEPQSKGRDVDRDDGRSGGHFSDNEDGVPGKADPSSARGVREDKAGDGMQQQQNWTREQAPSTLTRARPLAGGGEESAPQSVVDEAPEVGVGSPTDQNQTQTPFLSTASDSSVASEPEARDDEDRWRPKSLNRDALDRIARNLKKDEDARPVQRRKTATGGRPKAETEEDKEFSGQPGPASQMTRRESVERSTPTDDGEDGGKKRRPTALGAPLMEDDGDRPAGGFSREIKTDDIDVGAVAHHDQQRSKATLEEELTVASEAGADEISEPSEPSEQEVDEAWGNSTQMWAGQTSSAAEDEDEQKPPTPRRKKSTQRDIDDFRRREKSLGGRKEKPSLADRLKKKKSGLKARLTKELKVDQQVESLSLQESLKQETVVSEEEVDHRPKVSEGGSNSYGKGKLKSRLSPGKSDEDDDLNVPEPQESKKRQTEAARKPAGLTELDSGPKPKAAESGEGVETVDFDLLWKQGMAATPKMGILKRRLDSSLEYKPRRQLATGHSGQVALALSPNHQRLVTAGQEGSIRVWSAKGQSQLEFQPTGSAWVEVGFIEGERFLFGLYRQGGIALWLLPEDLSDESASVSEAIVDRNSSTKYRCGRYQKQRSVLLVGTDNGHAELWDLARGRCAERLEGHQGPVSAVAFGEKGPITASSNGQIRLWNRQGLQIDQIETTGAVRGLAAMEGKVLWVEASGALMMIREGASRAIKLRGHHGEGRSVDFRDDGYCISGGEDGRLLVYDGKRDEPDQEIHIPAPIHQVVMSQKLLATSCAGATVFLFGRTGN